MAKTLTVVVSALIAGISCIVASERIEPSGPPVLQRGISVTQTYIETCAKCHGQDGEGGGGGTRTLLTEDKFDQKYDKPFFDAIKNGVPDMGMDAYGQTMSDEQVWGQVVHIRELQAKALRAKNGSPKATNGVYKSKLQNYKIETVIEAGLGLETPWAIDWLPDGQMLITNRPGFIYLAQKGNLGLQVSGLPESREQGQGGLMEVAVHPDYKRNGWIYLAYSEPGKSGGAMTKIVRGKLKIGKNAAAWTSQQTIWEADQKFYTGAGQHFGSRIVFDGKGFVYFAVGERGGNMLAQELTNPFGKIFRVKEDGTIPSDNPFASKADAIKGIWSYGHRNQQGMVMGLDGRLWVTEHGPRGGDEVNEIKKGANYGWPVVAFSINYNDAPFRVPWPKPGQDFTMPIFRWLPSIGVSGMDVMRGSAFPKWNGDILAGGLSGANLDRIRTKDGKLVEREELVYGMGRVREVAVGPDGFIYVALNSPDKIIRLVPAP
ncbi:MAG: PQQ-dependent sugar dehydrogenase [Fimbriimonadaceae bacterium]